MRGTDMKEMEVGYLYYSLYSYRRKIEADIKKVIRAKNEIRQGSKSRCAGFAAKDTLQA